MGRRSTGMPFAGLAWCAAVLLGAAVVAGCESEETPPSSPTPSPTVSGTAPSASPSPSPSPSAPTDVPAAAKEKSEKGAKAFARFYIEQSGRAWTVPDASLLDGLATENCATCKSLAATAKDLEDKGQRYSSMPIKVVSLVKFRGNDSEWVFDSTLMEQKVDVVGPGGEVIDNYPARQIEPAIAVVWREGQWWIDGIGD